MVSSAPVAGFSTRFEANKGGYPLRKQTQQSSACANGCDVTAPCLQSTVIIMPASSSASARLANLALGIQAWLLACCYDFVRSTT